MRRRAFALLPLLLLASSARAGELETLVSWMTGSFSSATQAEADRGAEQGPYALGRQQRKPPKLPKRLKKITPPKVQIYSYHF